MSNISQWYLIKEISLSNYIRCIKPIYDIIERKQTKYTCEDPFMKAIVNLTEDEWTRKEDIRLKIKVLESRLGIFHQSLMGCINGFEDYGIGHPTGCDIGSKDGKVCIEIKNRYNTMNSSSSSAVYKKLSIQANNGKRAILAQIVCPDGKCNKKGKPSNVEVMNGRQIYALLTGRDDFYEDLLYTITNTFKLFRSFKNISDLLDNVQQP